MAFGEMIFGIIGGLGLFLFGMQTMAEGLQKAAGKRMRQILEKLTNNPVMGVLMGALVTAIIQSSSATTVMVVGFVNAGLMTLRQAVGVILGANIGTTITAQLIAFNLKEYALPAIGIGFALTFLSKKKSVKYLGQILLGFGLLFYGMEIMSSAMKPLRSYPAFIELLASFGHHPLLGVLAAAAFTAIVQSSSATTVIIIALVGQGIIDMKAAISLVFGINIGTTVTALLASIGTSLTARRAALAHMLFNIGGVILFLPFINPFMDFVVASTRMMAEFGETISQYPLFHWVGPIEVNLKREVANAHTFFNIINTVLVLPFISYFIRLIVRILPGEDESQERGLKFIDPQAVYVTPVAIALRQATKEIVRMGILARENVKCAMDGFFNNDRDVLEKVLKTEEVIDNLEREIVSYLATLSQKSMTDAQSERMASLLHAVNDIERIGDHAEAIAVQADSKVAEKLPFSDTALEELHYINDLVDKALDKTVVALETGNVQLAREIIEIENEIDVKEKFMRDNHIRRLNEQTCYPGSAVVFLDLLSNLERIGDHAHNIAQIVIEDA